MTRTTFTVTAMLCFASCKPSSGGADLDDTTGTTADASNDGGEGTSGSSGDDADGTSSGEGPPADECFGRTVDERLEPDADGRSLELDCGDQRLAITVVDDGIVRVRRAEPDAGEARPSYAVVAEPAPGATAVFGRVGDRTVACTTELWVEVDAECRIRVEDRVGALLVDEGADGGWRSGRSDPTAHELVRRLGENERFYGLGARTGGLDRRGHAYEVWATDAYDAAFGGFAPEGDPLYSAIPFAIGLRDGTAYGMFVDDPGRVRWDFGADDPSQSRVTTRADDLTEYVIAGPTIADVVERYTWLTGRMPMPPRWALGFHQSRWGYPDADTVRQVALGFRDRNLPADGMWLDIQHMDGFRSWTWDPVTYADPADLVADLADVGFKTVAIVDPGIKLDPGWDVYDSGAAGGHYLLRDGEPYVGEVWPGAAVFPDFTDPDTREWWANLVPRALDHGVRGLWIDMNEPSSFLAGDGFTVPDDVAAAGDGHPATMGELHNAYALQEARATFAGMQAAAGDRRPFLLSRAGYAGIGRYAGMWTGDAPSTWVSLADTLPMLTSLGLSGVAIVGSDVGGYSGHATPELFARWMQLGLASPFFRGHVTSGVPGQEPWMFGTEIEDISRATLELRYRLLPYLYSLVAEAHETGAPILRPLVWDFADDPQTHALADEALLGPWLLVAPVLEPGATTRSIYLPAGRWFELLSGVWVDGPTTMDVDVRLGALPIWVREGAIVPLGPTMMWSDAAAVDPLTLELYPADVTTELTLYEDAGDGPAYARGEWSRVRYTLRGTATGATLEIDAREGSFELPTRHLELRVRRVDHGADAVFIDGEEVPQQASLAALAAADLGWWYDERDLSLRIRMPDTVGTSVEIVYDRTTEDPAPPVSIPVVVHLPAGTPMTTPIHWASSANGWEHESIEWGAAPDTAVETITVPRGRWYEYKWTRGDWDSVEKWPDCVEATNRYRFGAAWPEVEDTVWEWADLCGGG